MKADSLSFFFFSGKLLYFFATQPKQGKQKLTIFAFYSFFLS